MDAIEKKATLKPFSWQNDGPQRMPFVKKMLPKRTPFSPKNNAANTGASSEKRSQPRNESRAPPKGIPDCKNQFSKLPKSCLEEETSTENGGGLSC